MLANRIPRAETDERSEIIHRAKDIRGHEQTKSADRLAITATAVLSGRPTRGYR